MTILRNCKRIAVAAVAVLSLAILTPITEAFAGNAPRPRSQDHRSGHTTPQYGGHVHPSFGRPRNQDHRNPTPPVVNPNIVYTPTGPKRAPWRPTN